jgi:hypothetical protein
MVTEELRIDHPRLALPAWVFRHRENQPETGELLLEFPQLVEECRRLAVAIRVDKRDAMGKSLLADVEEHAPKDGDANPAGDEDERPCRLLGQREVTLGRSTSTSVPIGISCSVRLKALSLILVAKPRTPFSFGDVTTLMCRRSPLSSW